VNCPVCTSAVPGGDERCPACGSMVAPYVIGAAAPEPRPRVEPLREIPGLRKRERTWKDEVRERVRDRRTQREPGSELPLFPDVDDVPLGTPESGAPDETPAPRTPETRFDFRQDDDDLPLRPAEVPPELPSPDLPSPDFRSPSLSHRPALDERTVLDDDPAPEEDWSLGPASGSAENLRPVERPARAGERAAAGLLDLLVLGALAFVVVYFSGRAARVPVSGLLPVWPYLAGYLAFLGVIYAAYFTGATGQTIGKMAAGLRVVDASGAPPSYPRALVRAILGSLGVAMLGGGLVPLLLDPARRALHDRALKTRVIKG
jgi:uncharacterized RDD family membrane protein YckC